MSREFLGSHWQTAKEKRAIHRLHQRVEIITILKCDNCANTFKSHDIPPKRLAVEAYKAGWRELINEQRLLGTCCPECSRKILDKYPN